MFGKSKFIFLLIIIAFVAPFSLSGCSEDTSGEPAEAQNWTKEKKQKILADAYNNYIKRNLSDADKYAKDLVNHSENVCGTGTDPVKCGKDNAKMGFDCIKHDWIELTEYATRRLQIFNYLGFQEQIYTNLNTELNALEEPIFKGSAPSKTDPRCQTIKDAVAGIKAKVDKLNEEWDKAENKALFLSANDPEAGIKNLFEGMKSTFNNVNEHELAKPAGLNTSGVDEGTANATKTAAPNAKRGGWVVYQVVYRGPYFLYTGDYKGVEWKESSLQKYLKSVDPDLEGKISAEFGNIKEAFDGKLAKDDSNSLEDKINAGSADSLGGVKKAIKAIKDIALLFGQAKDKVK